MEGILYTTPLQILKSSHQNCTDSLPAFGCAAVCQYRMLRADFADFLEISVAWFSGKFCPGCGFCEFGAIGVRNRASVLSRQCAHRLGTRARTEDSGEMPRPSPDKRS